MKQVASNFYYSFPIQLLVLHVKRNHFLLLFWLFLFFIVTYLAGVRYGIPLLFLDPEYLGQVSFLSFFLLGLAFGAFLMIWNVTSYILHARHFPFLATLSRPFGVYCLNNSVIPLSFLLVYLSTLLIFQRNEGLQDLNLILWRITGLISGVTLLIGLSMVYFFSTNKNIFQVLGVHAAQEELPLPSGEPSWAEKHAQDDRKVLYYINHQLGVKRTRPIGHYPANLILGVYRQHHLNALFIQLAALLLIIVLAHLIDYPVFRIPAGCSILLLFSIITMIIGAISYWLRGWKILVSILALVVIDLLIGRNLLQYNNKAFGIDDQLSKPIYSLSTIREMNSPENMAEDSLQTIEVLNNWRQKFPVNDSPKLVLINCSGGGLRAGMFVMDALQTADSLSNGELMKHSILMTGASGGMMAAAYYRELYYRKLSGEHIQPASDTYLNNISSDLLNAVSYTLVVNDLFYPWQTYQLNEAVYRKDRGYIFEKALHENTDSVLFKTVSSYYQAEHSGSIPMLLFSPTIINDERKLFIGAQSFSYLGVPDIGANHHALPDMDGIDMHDLLGNEQANALLLSSAIRMSCTFPYILPTVHLPTQPEIEIMDAGIRDNFGIESTVRFIIFFREWIAANTGGVIIVNLRGMEQELPIQENVSKGVIEKLFSPIGNIYLNWVEVQDYQNDFQLYYLNNILKAPLDVFTIAYQPEDNTKRASLSLHLTAREKQDIRQSVISEENMEVMELIRSLLE
jgi:hypothetical protein